MTTWFTSIAERSAMEGWPRSKLGVAEAHELI